MKLTGKEGEHTVAALVVQDTVSNLLLPGNLGSETTSLDSDSLAAVMRYRRDIGNRYTFGVLLTSREGDEYSNQLLGIDGDLRLTDTDRLQVQLYSTRTQYPDKVAADYGQPCNAFRGTAIEIVYRHDTRTLDIWSRYSSSDDGFRADLGFIPQVDIRRYRAGSSYTWIGQPGQRYSMVQISTEIDWLDDGDGNLLDHGFWAWVEYFGPLQSSITLIAGRSREGYQDTEYDKFSLQMFSSLHPSSSVDLSLEAVLRDQVDYDNHWLGKQLRLRPALTLRLGRHLQLDLDYTFEQLQVEGERLYRADAGESRLIYQINRRAFVRAIMQYLHVRRDQNLSTLPVEPESQQLFTQLLLSYKLNPRTMVFAGYSDRSLGSQDLVLTRADRTFFIKLGYAWTF
jgi:hypothetical protein